MYTEIYLRLEPLGLELVAGVLAPRGTSTSASSTCRSHKQADYLRLVESWRPDAIAFGVNYLANIPEVIDLAARRGGCCRAR